MSVALSSKFLFLFTLKFNVKSRSLIINTITLLLHFCGPKWPYTILKNISWKQIVIYALWHQQLHIKDTKCCYFCPKSPHLWLRILYDWVTVPAVFFVITVSKTTKITNCSRYKKSSFTKGSTTITNDFSSLIPVVKVGMKLIETCSDSGSSGLYSQSCCVSADILQYKIKSDKILRLTFFFMQSLN